MSILILICWSIFQVVSTQNVAPVSQNGCGSSKMCLFFPENCNPTSDCVVGLTYAVNGDGSYVSFEMTIKKDTTKSKQYLAIGFSDDKSMGGETVSACIWGNGQPSAFLGYNTGRSNSALQISNIDQVIVGVEGGLFEDRYVCRFRQIVKSSVENVPDLDKEYTLLLATGPASDNSLQYHGPANGYPRTITAINVALPPGKIATVIAGVTDKTTTTTTTTTTSSTSSAGNTNDTPTQSVKPVSRNGCGTTKGCYFFPDDCDPSSNCVIGLTFAANNDGSYVTFELTSHNYYTQQYAAVGFSDDKKMGGESVSACLWDRGRTTKYLGNNVDKTHNSITRSNFDQVIPSIEGGSIDGSYVCRFRQYVKSSLENVPNLDKDYNLLLAIGTVSRNNLQIHKFTDELFPKIISPKVNVASLRNFPGGTASTSDSGVSQKSKSNLKKSHGILMLIGWWIFCAMAILFARYFKKMWPNTNVFKLALWFQFHRGLNMTAVLVMVAGLVCVFVAEGWVINDTHQICGIISVTLAIIQPFGALFRCGPTAPKRPIFNWIHRLIGVSAWILAAVTIWFATDFQGMGLHKNNNGDGPRALIITYWVILFLCIVGLEIHFTLAERLKKNPAANEPISLGRVEPDGHFSHTPVVPANTPKTSPPYSFVRIVCIGIFGITAVVITIALGIMIGTF